MIRLRPLRDDEFAAFAAASRAGYADDLERNGRLSRAAARRKAEQDFAALFPGAAPNPEQTVFVVEESETGRAVGRLWYVERERLGERVLWLYDIEIEPAERGRGYGRAAMLRLEQEARERGVGRVELNVFGGNEVARGLYRSLGYQEAAVTMVKDVEPAT